MAKGVFRPFKAWATGREVPSRRDTSSTATCGVLCSSHWSGRGLRIVLSCAARCVWRLSYENEPLRGLIIDPMDGARKPIISDTSSTAAIAINQNETIRQRAYAIWEREGHTGNPEDHWFRALQELVEQGQERSAATVEDAPPAAAEANSAATSEIPDER
jgi:hypothetical protein